MRVFVIREDVFKTEPLFVLGCEFEVFRRYIKKRFPKIDLGLEVGQCGQMFTFDVKPWRIVWARSYDFPVILHETFHLVTRICQDKGVPIKAQVDEGNGDETAAYLFEFFARRIMKRMPRAKSS